MNTRSTIGILTLHYGFNEGALLQAHCLAHALARSAPGRPVEIVDQRYPGKQAVYGPPGDPRKRALQRAIDTWLPLSKKRFDEAGHAAVHRYIRDHCAAVVLGSDQIWCLKYRVRCAGLLRSQPYGFFPAFPNAYWPDESIGVPRIAYAASAGEVKWEDIPGRDRKRMERTLRGFALLSVREQRTLDFLAWISPAVAAQATLVPDPTFAHDALAGVDRAALRQKLEAAGVDFSRPRIGVISKPGPEVEKAVRALRSDGAQIVGITTPNAFCDVRLWDLELHPLEWAALFGFMDYCILERMHACIFSLQNRTPFVAIDINEPGRARNQDTKLRHLMRLFGMESWCLRKSELRAESLLEACRSLGRTLQVDDTLGRLRGQADAFLKRAAPWLETRRQEKTGESHEGVAP